MSNPLSVLDEQLITMAVAWWDTVAPPSHRIELVRHAVVYIHWLCVHHSHKMWVHPDVVVIGDTVFEYHIARFFNNTHENRLCLITTKNHSAAAILLVVHSGWALTSCGLSVAEEDALLDNIRRLNMAATGGRLSHGVDTTDWDLPEDTHSVANHNAVLLCLAALVRETDKCPNATNATHIERTILLLLLLSETTLGIVRRVRYDQRPEKKHHQTNTYRIADLRDTDYYYAIYSHVKRKRNTDIIEVE